MCKTRHLVVGEKHPDFPLTLDKIHKNCIKKEKKKLMPLAITLQIIKC